MTPVSINSLPKEILFHIFALAEKSPKDLLAHRTVCKQWNENITEFFYTKLNQLKTYNSKFLWVDRAIQQIPESAILHSLSILEIIKNFNAAMVDYDTIIHPWPIIPCKQEVMAVEKQLEEIEILEGLWWSLPIDDKPELETVAEIKRWFENEQNQPLLDTVTILDLSNKRIDYLPKELFKLRNLKKLNLMGNEIRALPDSIKVWTQLEELDLHNNELTDLPDHAVMKHLKSLKWLDLGRNLIRTLPDSIKACTQLEELSLHYNHLTDLPDHAIKHLKNLRSLCISVNQFISLPPSVAALENLEELDVEDNFLTELPLLNSWEKIKKICLIDNYLHITKEQAEQMWPNATEIYL